jgi:3-phosphoglycerate kinase
LASEYLNRFEQYVIVLKTNTLVGPMNVFQFEQFRRQNAALLEGIDLLDESSRFDGGGEVLQARGKCTNPKPVP